MTNTAESCQIAINYKIAETVLPPHIIEILRYFDIRYIDLRLWNESYKPTLISCFAFKDKHGSYYFDDEKYGMMLQCNFVTFGVLVKILKNIILFKINTIESHNVSCVMGFTLKIMLYLSLTLFYIGKIEVYFDSIDKIGEITLKHYSDLYTSALLRERKK